LDNNLTCKKADNANQNLNTKANNSEKVISKPIEPESTAKIEMRIELSDEGTKKNSINL